MENKGKRLEDGLVKVSINKNGQVRTTIPRGCARDAEIDNKSILKFSSHPGRILRVEVLDNDKETH